MRRYKALAHMRRERLHLWRAGGDKKDGIPNKYQEASAGGVGIQSSNPKEPVARGDVAAAEATKRHSANDFARYLYSNGGESNEDPRPVAKEKNSAAKHRPSGGYLTFGSFARFFYSDGGGDFSQGSKPKEAVEKECATQGRGRKKAASAHRQQEVVGDIDRYIDK